METWEKHAFNAQFALYTAFFYLLKKVQLTKKYQSEIND